MTAWLALFDIRKPNPQAAFRAACSVTLATLLAFYLQLSIPYWAAVSAAVVSLNYYQASFNKALHRLLGTLLGGILGALLSLVVKHHMPLFLITSTVVLSSSFYISQLSRYPYLFLMGGITAVLTLAMVYINQGSAWEIAYDRTFEISLGVICALCCSRFIFYNDAEKEFKKNLTGFYVALNAIVHASDITDVLKQRRTLHQLITKDQKLIDLFFTDIKILGLSNAQANSIFQTQQNLLNALDYFFQLGINLEITNNDICSTIRDNLSCLLTALANHDIEGFKQHYQDKKTTFINLESKLTNFYAELYEIIFIHLCNIHRILLAQPTALPEAKPWYKQPHATEIARQYLFFAIKTGFCFFIAAIFWIKFGGASAIQGLMTAMIIAPQKNIFDQANIAKQRTYGSVIGASLGLIAIALLPYKVALISPLIFIVGWLFSYLYLFGEERWKNVGLQANVAFIIAVVHNQAIFSNVLILQRLWGVFVGIAVILIITWLIWPQHPYRLLSIEMQKIAQTFQQLLKNIESTKLQHRDLQTLFETINWRFSVCEKLLESIANLRGYHNPRYHLLLSIYHRLHDIESFIYVAWLLMEHASPDKPLHFSEKVLEILHHELDQFNHDMANIRQNKKAILSSLNNMKIALKQEMVLLQ